MSDAPLSNDATPTPSSSPADNHDHPAQSELSPKTNWQTVNFPDILNVDGLPPLVDAATTTDDPTPSNAAVAAAVPTPSFASTKPSTPPAQPIADSSEPTDAPLEDALIVEPDWQPTASHSDPAAAETVTTAAAIDRDEAAIAPGQSQDELVVLIHELNECNDALLARVQYLETALAQSQQRYDATQVTLVQHEQEMGQAQELLQTAQTQLTHATDELEFARQSVQRQDIQIETLSEQHEASQQRIAELERECALVQQRYQEQSHRLNEEKAIAQDLQSRLQRQQRYTMQYKVALKKCLEVPPPAYRDPQGQGTSLSGTTALNGLGAVDMMPAAPGIQPWSTQNRIARPKFRWTPPEPGTNAADNPLQKDLWATPIEPAVEPAAAAGATTSADEASSAEFLPAADQTEATLDAAAANLADLPTAMTAPTDWQNPEALATALTQSTPAAFGATGTPDVDSLPLPDLLGETEPTGDGADGQAARSRDSISYTLTADEATAHAQAATADLLRDLETPRAAAEDALWEDLARLIDASAEANSGTDATATDGDDITFADGQTPATTAPTPSVFSDIESAIAAVSAPTPETNESLAADLSPTSPPESSAQSEISPQLFAETAPRWQAAQWAQPTNSPAPVVYPLRTQKRRASLAAVELPSFPRPAAPAQ